MHIEYLATGEELLDGRTLNKNASYLGDQLNQIGLDLKRVTTIGDHLDTLVAVIKERLQACDCLIISGGLGPTDDDRTREALSKAFNLPLEYREAAMTYIQQYFTTHNREMNPQNKVQAYAPKTANLILSGYGTAPGLHIAHNNKTIYALPGVPKELAMMFEADILPTLTATQEPQFHQKRWTIHGLGESDCQALFAEFYPLAAHLDIGFRASIEGIQLQLKTTQSPNDTTFLKVAEAIQVKIADHCISNTETTLAKAVTESFQKRKWTLSLAESCTGGLLAKTLTDLPGASAYFIESAVTYASEQKHQRLGVSYDTLKTFGAVSEETAKEMAIGSKQTTNSTCAVAVTGIAGPGGGSSEKPVGTVWIAIASEIGIQTKKLVLGGDRQRIRQKTVSDVLWELHKLLNSHA